MHSTDMLPMARVENLLFIIIIIIKTCYGAPQPVLIAPHNTNKKKIKKKT